MRDGGKAERRSIKGKGTRLKAHKWKVPNTGTHAQN